MPTGAHELERKKKKGGGSGGTSKFDNATPVLNKLQWLSIRQKAIYEQWAMPNIIQDN